MTEAARGSARPRAGPDPIDPNADLLELVDAVMVKHPAGDKGARAAVRMVATGIGAVILRAGAELAQIRARLDQIEAKRLDYRGIWKGGIAYPAGSWVTHDGSLFFCHRETGARPGASADWQLAVKRGRDRR